MNDFIKCFLLKCLEESKALTDRVGENQQPSFFSLLNNKNNKKNCALPLITLFLSDVLSEEDQVVGKCTNRSLRRVQQTLSRCCSIVL